MSSRFSDSLFHQFVQQIGLWFCVTSRKVGWRHWATSAIRFCYQVAPWSMISFAHFILGKITELLITKKAKEK